PQVDLVSARERYLAYHQATRKGLVTACHDCSDGGLAVALAEMCIGGRLGASVDLAAAPCCGCEHPLEALYSESASRLVVSVAPQQQAAFEALFAGQQAARIGVVGGTVFTAAFGGAALFSAPVEFLAQAFKAPLDW
ncbi:MAG: phosphoribosylformylglycinamidine synthase, partial [Desulfovibrio sp.]|nr:phosphoribosylformylglycinamidine synthase [Desulfovibrio sp.]